MYFFMYCLFLILVSVPACVFKCLLFPGQENV
uniref:Uncharacterized protein n=1 Tax=Anguilla anguilla TaxID=7936 RepID=A0A0E9RQQ8_ANGAN